MTAETALWIVGSALLPLLGWGVHITWNVLGVRNDVADIKKRLERPEQHGIGTSRMNALIEDNTRAMRALTHYISWLAREQTGREPPPPIDD